MNPNPDEQLLARWLDGELNAAEKASFDARLNSDAALRSEADSLQSLRDMLHTGFPKIAEVPHADFFNSQIQERISEMRRAEQSPVARRRAITFLDRHATTLNIGSRRCCLCRPGCDAMAVGKCFRQHHHGGAQHLRPERRSPGQDLPFQRS